MIETLLIIWVIGFVVFCLLGFSGVGGEPTAHGQELIIGYVIAFGLVWPIAIPLFVALNLWEWWRDRR